MTKIHTAKVDNLAPVAHACNPSYSGDRDQDCDLKPARVNSSWDPSSKKKKPSQKRLVEWLKV
jgi:hypothetical protein